MQRFGTDPRVQASFGTRPLVAPSDSQLGMLALLRTSGAAKVGSSQSTASEAPE
jgi:hypothetical protein